MRLIESGCSMRAAARIVGVSPASAHRWRGASEAERASRSCLASRPPTPRSCPWRLDARAEQRILAARERTNLSPARFAGLVGYRRSTGPRARPSSGSLHVPTTLRLQRRGVAQPPTASVPPEERRTLPQGFPRAVQRASEQGILWEECRVSKNVIRRSSDRGFKSPLRWTPCALSRRGRGHLDRRVIAPRL